MTGERNTPAFIALTARGAALARRLKAELGGEVHGLTGRVDDADIDFTDTGAHLRAHFAAGRPIVGICAAGILIRALAPLLADKAKEPPVVAVAEDGSAVVPLIGGHRGANALARQIAAILGGDAAITTASDLGTGVALDAPPPGWRLVAAPDLLKTALARMAAGSRPSVTVSPDLAEIDRDWLGPTAADEASPDADRLDIIIAETAAHAADPDALLYVPARHTIGVGCARHCDPAELAALAKQAIGEAGLRREAIAGVFSIDLKSDEAAMQALARELGVPARFYSAGELEAELPRLANPSEAVFREVGSHGVAEAAALAATGPDGQLVVPKMKTANATAAIARAPLPLGDQPGRPRGQLAVIGIGPGADDWRTPEASRLINEAQELVGYGHYLDLIAPLAAGKPTKTFPLGAEEERSRYALERAGEGRNVALISSGDAGIYAMGALVMELLDRPERENGVSAAARRVEVVNAPGITALQAASARIGALVGHDFCAISLSDLLTPRDDIIARVKAAAAGDFVIAFYNPVSARRRTLLNAARDILLGQRPAETPVLIAANLGRAEEKLTPRTLSSLNIDEVDMLTVVLIGSSQSRAFSTGDGQTRFYTPRGYAAKQSMVPTS